MGKKVYIAGPITGISKFYLAFEEAEDALLNAGFFPLNPVCFPDSLSKAEIMRLCLGMIDAADAVLFLPGSSRSAGASLEHHYCEYIGKPTFRTIDDLKEAMK